MVNEIRKTSKKRIHYTVAKKIEACKYAFQHSYYAASKRFRVTKTMVQRWNHSYNDMIAVPMNLRATTFTFHPGPKPCNPALEKALFEFTKERNANAEAVTCELLIEEAIAREPTWGTISYENLRKRIYRFMNRYKLVQKAVNNFSILEENQMQHIIGDFRFKIHAEIKNKKLKRDQIYNIDQMAVNYENPPSKTIIEKGAKIAKLKTNQLQKKRATLLLGIRADGIKLPPLLVFKGAPNGRINKELEEISKSYERKCYAIAQSNAWTDEQVLSYWIKNIWEPFQKHEENIILLDSFEVHKKAGNSFQGASTAFIPEHTTPYLQPLDVGVNKIVRSNFKSLWVKEANKLSNAEEGQKEANARKTIFDWAIKAWDDISPDVIKNSFDKALALGELPELRIIQGIRDNEIEIEEKKVNEMEIEEKKVNEMEEKKANESEMAMEIV